MWTWVQLPPPPPIRKKSIHTDAFFVLDVCCPYGVATKVAGTSAHDSNPHKHEAKPSLHNSKATGVKIKYSMPRPETSVQPLPGLEGKPDISVDPSRTRTKNQRGVDLKLKLVHLLS